MTTRNCGSCRFYHANPANLKNGQCRECSPVPIAVGMSKTGPVVSGFHPPVSREHVCGKWQLKIELPLRMERDTATEDVRPPVNGVLGHVNGGEG